MASRDGELVGRPVEWSFNADTSVATGGTLAFPVTSRRTGGVGRTGAVCAVPNAFRVLTSR